MKKITSILITLALISLFATRLFAGAGDNCPISGNGVALSDFNFFGAKYKIITSTTSWTAVDTVDGVLYEVYAIRATSGTTGTGYLVATTTTTTLWNLVVIADTTNTSATDYLDPDSLLATYGNRFPIRYSAGLKAKSSDINLDLLILYGSYE